MLRQVGHFSFWSGSMLMEGVDGLPVPCYFSGEYSFFGSNWSCRQVGIQPRRTPTNDLPKSINDYEYDMHKQSRHCARTVLLISQVEGGQRGQDPRSI